MKSLTNEAIEFRSRVIDALQRVGYIDQDTIDAECPICGGTLSVYFAGFAPRAEMICRLGCAEADIAAAIGGSR
jgi:hypothetical protein